MLNNLPIALPPSNPANPAVTPPIIPVPIVIPIAVALPLAIIVPKSVVSIPPSPPREAHVDDRLENIFEPSELPVTCAVPVVETSPKIAFFNVPDIFDPNPKNFIPANDATIAVSNGATSIIPLSNSNADFKASHSTSAKSSAKPTKSTSFNNSPIFSPINLKSVLFKNVDQVSKTPLIQVVIISPKEAVSNSSKKLVNPSASELPKLIQSKFLPKDNTLYIAVFSEPAIVFPNSPNNSGEIRPFKKSARPFPKFLAPSYTLSQSIFLNAFVSVTFMCLPNSNKLSISLSNSFNMLSA